MGFEEYEKESSGPGGTKPRISLRKSGSIGLNASTVHEYFDGYDWAVLYYDNEDMRVGIRPMKGGNENSYKIQKREKENHGGSINATAFMREYDLIPDMTTQYRAKWHDEEELVYIELDNPVLVYDN